GANTLSKMSIARLDNGEYVDSNTENPLEDKHYYNLSLEDYNRLFVAIIVFGGIVIMATIKINILYISYMNEYKNNYINIPIWLNELNRCGKITKRIYKYRCVTIKYTKIITYNKPLKLKWVSIGDIVVKLKYYEKKKFDTENALRTPQNSLEIT
ncbi:4352_t:CDS:2, partial [Entrophospora sp. SA101]